MSVLRADADDPIGAMKIGVGSFMPNSSIDKSRCELSTIIRGTRPHF